MGEKATLAKARQELEDLYLGVPDESVNITLKDFANLQQNGGAERKTSNLNTIQENTSAFIAKSPSLDFSKGLQATKDQRNVEDEIYRDHTTPNNSRHNKATRNMVDSSMAYDDMSIMSRTSRSPYEDRGGRRRPGIPHTKICTVCSEYVYIFRHRCLVCGRVYCRQCVSVGMGEMTEGRKCIECLGRRFSERYIKRAGQVGCCTRYPSMVKQQELKWAEKGPRKTGERRHGRSVMVSRSASPIMPRTPIRANVSSPPSFVMGSPYSHHHPIPY